MEEDKKENKKITEKFGYVDWGKVLREKRRNRASANQTDRNLSNSVPTTYSSGQVQTQNQQNITLVRPIVNAGSSKKLTQQSGQTANPVKSTVQSNKFGVDLIRKLTVSLPQQQILQLNKSSTNVEKQPTPPSGQQTTVNLRTKINESSNNNGVNTNDKKYFPIDNKKNKILTRPEDNYTIDNSLDQSGISTLKIDKSTITDETKDTFKKKDETESKIMNDIEKCFDSIADTLAIILNKEVLSITNKDVPENLLEKSNELSGSENDVNTLLNKNKTAQLTMGQPQ